MGMGRVSGERERYCELNTLAREASYVASTDQEKYDKMKKFMKEIISQKKDSDQGVYSHTAWLPKGYATGKTIEVGDPKKVNSKGAKKRNKRAGPVDDHPMTKNV